MKKILNKVILSAGTLGVIIAGAAAFSAFEAHVVNVTATIENALSVPQELNGISFGTVFPEEVLHRNLDISLSESFVGSSRVDDVSYMIRQKPKCMADSTENSVQFAQVTDGPDGTFVCPAGYHQLALLCPYLSKHLLVNQCNPALPVGTEGACTGIDAFHGDINNWTASTTVATQVIGHLVKGGNITDTWDIDLHAPCFKGQCAQDNVIPASFQPDPKLNGQMFGCDLWVEVTGISLPNGGGHLTVVKHVNNDSGTQDNIASDFTMNVSGVNATPSSFPGSEGGTLVTMSAGAYTVTETNLPGYSSSASADCSGIMAPNENKTCTITNTANRPETASLTVNKVVVGTSTPVSAFTLMVDGSTVTSGVATTTTPGSHTVSEGSHPGYTSVISGDCNPDTGIVTVPASGSASCTITNTWQPGHLIVHKDVVITVEGTNTTAASFQMMIDGSNVIQDASNTVNPGNHTVSEISNPNYDVTFSAECPGGIANVPAGATVTCTVTNTQKHATLILNKVVVNDNGGNNVASDFALFASGSDATTQLTNGVAKNVAVGTLFINEQGVVGYQATFSGDCDSSGQITLAEGENKQCTITNNDIAPNITLSKVVDSGIASPFSFTLRIDGTFAPQGSSVSVTSNSAHVITEDAHTGYHFVSITGSAKCPSVLGGTATLDEGEAITCTIHNAQD